MSGDADDEQPSPSPDALLIAIALACCTVALSYASLRLLQKFRYPDPDPRVVLSTARIAFYWRGLIALFVGALGGIAALAAQRRWGARVDRFLPYVLVVTIAVGVAQGVLVP